MFPKLLTSLYFAHAEVLGIQWAIDKLPELAKKYGTEVEYQFKMVTQYIPCPGDTGCANAILGGMFEAQLSATAGTDVNVEIWHYPDPDAATGAVPYPYPWYIS